jgi:thiamine pyrophosphate-dependent acetolactate synthase large subunit-like protein
MELTGAQIMMEVLKEEEVDTIFGFPGQNGYPTGTGQA